MDETVYIGISKEIMEESEIDQEKPLRFTAGEKIIFIQQSPSPDCCEGECMDCVHYCTAYDACSGEPCDEDCDHCALDEILRDKGQRKYETI